MPKTANWIRKPILNSTPLLEYGLLLVVSFICVFLYRLGSARVDRGQVPGLRDMGTYLNAGSLLFRGIDPYSDPNYRAGPVILILFGILEKTNSPYILAWVLQFLVPIGIVYFIRFFSGLHISSNLVLYLVVIFLSSLRENLVNIQITGLISLLFAYGVKLSLYMQKSSNLRGLLGLFLVGMSIDAKPHLFLLAAIVVFITQRQMSKFFLCSLLILLMHLILSCQTSTLITLRWIKQLIGLHEMKINGKLGESIFLNWIFEFFSINPRVSILFSVFSCGILVTYLMQAAIKKLSVRAVFSLAMLVPAYGIFFHYYDLALAIGCTLVLLYTRGSKLFPYLSLFFAIPENVLQLESVFLICIVSVMQYFLAGLDEAVRPHYILAPFAWITYGLLASFLPDSISIHSFQMSLSVILLTFILLRISRDELNGQEISSNLPFRS